MPEEKSLAAAEQEVPKPTQSEIDGAKRFFTSGDMLAAENAARDLTRKFPHHAFGWKVRGAVAKATGRTEDALEPMRHVARLEPDDPVGHYNLGVVLADTRRFAEAETSYREAIRRKQDFAAAHFSLGNMLAFVGRWHEAESCYGEAIRIDPAHPEAHGNLGLSLFNLGRLDEAVRSYREAIRRNPAAAASHYNLGIALNALGRISEAEQSFREAIRRQPDFAEGYVNLGNALVELGRSEEAERSYRAAIDANSACAEAWYNLGVLLSKQGRASEAEQCYRDAIQNKPDYAEAHFSLGIALDAAERPNEAAASLRAAIRTKPNHAEYHYYLGNMLATLQRLNEAESSYRQAIHLRPDHAQAHCHLGTVLADLGWLSEAEKSYRQAIGIKPSYAEAHGNLAVTLAKLGRLNEAEKSYREAIRRDPDLAEARSGLGLTLVDLCRLDEVEAVFREALRRKPDYTDAHSSLLFAMNYVESVPSEAALAEAQRYGSKVSARAVPKFQPQSSSASSRRLKIGFVSGDLRGHPVGFFTEGLVKCLDREKFDLYAFPTSPHADDLTLRIKPNFNSWIPIVAKSDHDAATLVHAQEIDVLVDLSGHSARNRLPVFSYRPAPVQVSWLGYFATTGVPEMDYFLGDPHMAPAEEESHFSEKIWRLPETWLCFTPPTQAVNVAPPPALRNGHVTFGCFSNLSKVGDVVLDLWAEILHAVPSAKIMLKASQLADTELASQTVARFTSRGIAANRVILEGPSPRGAYLNAYSRIDIVLDTFPYPGGTTSLEALWMGVPILTRKGNRFLSRLGESIAANAGQHDWIAADRDDYAKKAIAFAADVTLLASTRATLRDRVLRTPLFDAQRFARHFGEALLGMYREKTGR